MKIITLAYKKEAKSDFDKSVLTAFIYPAFAGNHIVETELHISKLDLFDYDISVSGSYAEAHKKAHLSQMSEEEYDLSYEHNPVHINKNL